MFVQTTTRVSPSQAFVRAAVLEGFTCGFVDDALTISHIRIDFDGAELHP